MRMVGVLQSVLFLGAVCSALGQDASTAVPAPATPAPAVEPEKVCNSPGTICGNCDTVSMCIATGDGRFETLHQQCQADEKCVGGACVKGAVCNYRPFSCSQEGYYPDPYDCKKYHVCLPEGESLRSIDFDCPQGSSYNSSSQDCTSTMLSPACLARPVPECVTTLQMGAISEEDGLYYVCLLKENTLAPELRRCPAGRHFNPSIMTCVDSTSSSKSKKKKSKA